MKEDLNIDELFKSKFENFEGNVDPSAWANISQSIGAAGAGSGAGAVGGGLSGLSKVALIVGAAAITSFGVWYFTGNTDANEVSDNTTTTSEDITVPVENDNKLVSVEADNIENGESNPEHEANLSEESNNSSLQAEVEENLANNQNGSHENGNQELRGNSNETTEGPETNTNDNTNNTNESEEPTFEYYTETITPEADPTFKVKGNKVSFVSNAKDHNSVSWNFGDGSVESKDNVTHTYKRPGQYNVKMTVAGEGSIVEAILEVTIEGTSAITKVPTIITPSDHNNDNDYFFIESEGLIEFVIIIYDANMEPIFESHDPNFEWNGQGKDGVLIKGRCQFMINAIGEDGQTYQRAGSLTVQ